MKKNIKSQLATKSDIKDLKTSFRLEITSLEVKVDTKLEGMEKRIDHNAQRYTDQILESNDKLVKQLETMVDENTIGSNQLNSQLQNHERQIKKIERIQQVA